MLNRCNTLHLTLLAVVIVLLALVVACDQPEEPFLENVSATGMTEEEKAELPQSPGGTALVPEVDAGTSILVMLQDQSLLIQTEDIPPGPAVFEVTNGSENIHDFAVEGEGVSIEVDGTVAPTEMKTISMDLEPGTYTAYCPILDHRQKGEEVQFEVIQP